MRISGRILRPIGVRIVSTCCEHELDDRPAEHRSLRVGDPDRQLAVGLAREDRPVAGVGGLERDVGAGVRQPDDEDRAVAELRRVAVLVRVQLPDRRVELGGERRDVGLAERPGRDDDLARGEAPAVGGRHDEAAVDRLDAIDARPAPDGQVEPSRRTPRGSRPSRDRSASGRTARGSACPGASRSGRGCRAGASPSGPASGRRSARRHRGSTNGRPALREVVAGRQARLAGADDDRVDLLVRPACVHRAALGLCEFGGDRDRPVAMTRP